MDIITPTTERISHAGDRYESGRADPQLRTYKPARVLPRWDVLEVSGRITPDHANAGRTYERHQELASRATVTPSYGQRTVEGTPSHQLDDNAFQERAAAWVDYYALHRSAKAALGKRDVEFLDQFLAGWSLYALGGGGRKQASIHKAHARLITILDKLQAHYGQTRRRDPYP